MRLAIILIIYTLLNSILYSQLIMWINKFNNCPGYMLIKIIISIIYFICFISVITGYFLKKSKIQRIIQKLSNHFMGILFYIILVAVTTFIVQTILIHGFKVSKSVFYSNWYLLIIGSIYLILITFISIYGNLHAKNIKIKKYNLKINKKSKYKHLRIALVADFHLGYSVGYKMMNKMKDIINKEEVDVVLIAGDVFDNSFDSIDDINKVQNSLKDINSKYGKYAVFGNHDVEEKLFSGFSTKNVNKARRNKSMERILEKANINILNDEVISIGDFFIIGRKDYEKTGEDDNTRSKLDDLVKKVKSNKFVILLEHQPRNLKKISNFPIDLHVAGHTHAGQYFPINIGTKLIWENHYGLKKFNNMYSVVTSGIGVYGPNIRVGTNSEVVIIDIDFK